MAQYKAPVQDMFFLLKDVFDADSLWGTLFGSDEVSTELAKAILEEGAKVCETLLFPLNRSGDEEGCHFEEGIVRTPEGFKAAYDAYAENGWLGLGGDPDYGGQGMPKMLTVLFEEMLFAANASFALYPALSCGAALALATQGTEAMKETYLRNIYEGRWAGTMCLTEPHCGTDLGILRTRAQPQDDGSYRLSGTKIFITGGDQDLTENIIHFVLAKLPDAPAGSKGISMFLVPKRLVNPDGSVGEANGVSCGSIEHKMGIKASSTCVLNFENAQGWLVGEVNKGLAAMFVMMNYERLSIGLQGQGAMDMAYQHALAYAKERIQGRAPNGAQSPDAAADSILVHPDVRRMLMTIKAYNEGSRAFAVYTGMQLDFSKSHKDDAVRQRSEQMVAILTPVAKAFLTDKGFECAVIGQQVFGGHGYVREWGIEQLVRDTRIAQIYEGTNGIQAMDLMGRKVVGSQGALLAPLLEEMAAAVQSAKPFDTLTPMAEQLTSTVALIGTVTEHICAAAKEDRSEIGAAAVEYLELIGLGVVAMMWLNMAVSCQKTEPEAGKDFAHAKLATARFYFERILPKTESLAKIIQAGSAPVMGLEDNLM